MTVNGTMLRCQRRCDHDCPARQIPRHADRYEIVINGGAASVPRNCIFTRIGTNGGPRRSAQFAAVNRPASGQTAARYQEIRCDLGKQGGIAS
jgi:hypothetical protein